MKKMNHSRALLTILGISWSIAATALTFPPIGGGGGDTGNSVSGTVIAVCSPPGIATADSGSCTNTGSGSSSCSSAAGQLSLPSQVVAVETSDNLPADVSAEIKGAIGDTCSNFIDMLRSNHAANCTYAGGGSIKVICQVQ